MSNMDDDNVDIYKTIRYGGFQYLFAAVVLLSIAISCTHVFLQANLFNDSFFTQRYWGDLGRHRPPYTKSQWVAFVLATYLFPTGIMALIIFMIQAFKSNHVSMIMKFGIFYSLLILAIASTVQSYKMASGLLQCGVFCWGNDYLLNQSSPSTPNLSAQYTFGMIYFFTSLIFTVATSAQTILLHLSLYYKGEIVVGMRGDEDYSKRFSVKVSKRITLEDTPTLTASLQNTEERNQIRSSYSFGAVNDSRKNATYYVLMILVFGGLFPFMIISCMSLPTWWAYFNPYAIQSYRASLPSQYISNINTENNDDDGNDHVVNKYNTFSWWNVSKYPTQYQEYIFLFPDIIMYYGLLYLIVMIALLTELFPEFRKTLLRRGHLPYKLCLGELLMVVFLSLFIGSYYPYWFVDHVWERGFINPTVIPVEDSARSMGQLSNVVCGLLILPVSRNSIWSLVFGVSYEVLIIYHKCIAVLFFVVVTLHMVLVWRVYFSFHSWPKDVLSVPTKYHSTDFTIPTASISYFVMFFCMGVCAYETVRRKHHEIFWFAHRFSIILFLIVLWHATMSWYYITVGIILYTVDHVIRFSRVIGTTVILEHAEVVEGSDSEVTCLTYKASETILHLYGKKIPLNYEMGQYFFVNIPELSILQWHPFSISSAPSDSPLITHHIKNMGRHQWTGKLAKLVKKKTMSDSKTALRKVVVNIDGPYGTPLKASQYDAVLFIAGGIGITPMHSCLRHIYLTLKSNPSAYPLLKKVRLVWMIRKNDKYLDSTFNIILSDNILVREDSKQIFSIAKYITGVSKDVAHDRGSSPIHGSQRGSVEKGCTNGFYEQTELYYGRASIDKEVEDFSEGYRQVCVYACGPKAMIDSAQDSCTKMAVNQNIEFREDTFSL